VKPASTGLNLSCLKQSGKHERGLIEIQDDHCLPADAPVAEWIRPIPSKLYNPMNVVPCQWKSE
jgi:hypothetical protein